MSQEILVLGANGYLGSNILDYFVAKGFNAIGLSRNEIDFLKKKSVCDLIKILNANQVVIVTTAITRSKSDTPDSCFLNLEILKNIINAFQINPPKKIIYLSAADVYGMHKENIVESEAGNPITAYGAFKIFSENILFCSLPKSDKICLRIPGVFGGKNDNSSLISKFWTMIKNDEEIFLSNSGKTKRNYLSVDMLQEAIECFILNHVFGSFNLACTGSIEIRQIVNIISGILKKPPKINFSHENNPRDFNLSLDNSLLLKKLPQLNDYKLKNELFKYLTDIANKNRLFTNNRSLGN